ncbi:hypothetical protein C2845_PM16G07410 [Panicum miliaceum]|uniref:Uncharacterized protein n=1 Tax=Panicum miliaceum TaxID=4540 RepID=A0A3L6PSF9_PANMI|nr:hypothetical protein C2845_PM16G07410 [Panicum miliaceum]
MGRKRRRDLVASISSGSDSDADLTPFDNPLSDSDEVENNDSDDAHLSNSNDTCFTDVDSLKKALLKECYRDYKKKIRDLKMNFKTCRINESIKSFNKAKCAKGTDPGTLGGCLYYLAVLYLDHVDFGPHRVPDSLPRISLWKKNMIKIYCDLDLKSPGCYGFRPLLDFSDTCYAKILVR